MIPIGPESKVSFHNYMIRSDRNQSIIEVVDHAEFYELEGPGVDAIARLAAGDTVEETQRGLELRYPDEDIELPSFIQQLVEMGLVASIDNQPVEAQLTTSPVPRGFTWIPAKVGRVFFHPAAWIGYSLLLLLNILYFLQHPNAIPKHVDLFPYEIMIANLSTWLGLSMVLLLIHEAGHVLALRANDLPARWRISNRLFLVVMETEMQEIWRLPARKRNIPYLGGMCIDQAVLFVLLLGLNHIDPVHTVLYGAIKIAVFQVAMMTIFQFMLFMKTDMYYVLENITGCYHLMEDAKAWMRARISGASKASMRDRREERVIRSYSLIYVLGMSGMGFLFVFYFIPQLLHMLNHAAQHLALGFTNLSMGMLHWQALDGVVILLLIAAQIVLLAYSWTRNWRQSRKELKPYYSKNRNQ